MARLRVLRDVVVGVYGPGNRAAFTFEKAIEQMEHLQQDLATQAVWDLPGFPSNSLYFETVPPGHQPRSGEVRMAAASGPVAYSSAPPLLPSTRTGAGGAPPAVPNPVADAVEPEAAPAGGQALQEPGESDQH